MRRLKDEPGAAAVEFALFLPVMVFMAAAAITSVRLVLTYAHLTELSRAGARYATRAALDPTTPGTYRLRPTTEEVVAYVEETSEVQLSSVSVSPDPSTAYPGTQVAVRVTSHVDIGPLGRAAGAVLNAFAGFFGSASPFPADGLELSSNAVMREE